MIDLVATLKLLTFYLVSRLLPVLSAAVILTAALLTTTTSALAYGVNECAAERFGSDLNCTANDVSITGITVAPGSPTSCVGGESVSIDLDVEVNFAAPDRYDIGIFFANDGNSPASLYANGGAETCSVAILPPESPFLDLEGSPDTCGDGNDSIGGTGTGVLRMTGVPVSCQAVALSGGRLFIPFVTSWDNKSGTLCETAADPVPSTKSKCNVPDGTVEADVLSSTVALVVMPSITKSAAVSSLTSGDSTQYDVTITNTTGATLSDAIFRDPAVENLTIDSLTCSATGGASCPASLSIATLQAGGLVLPDMPVDSSLTFTFGATVNPDTPAGTLTNTGYVVVDGESNSDDAEIDVYTKLGVSKSFAPDSIPVNEASTLTITLENTNLYDATGVGFSDTYPTDLVNASTPDVTNTCGGTVTATGGGNTLSLIDGTISAGGSCTVTVQVTSATAGAYTNATGSVTGSISGYAVVGDSASASIAIGTSNLSTSTKTVEDVNGGEADPGDTLRYTITLKETAGVEATNVAVSDTVSSSLTSLSVTSCPSGATCGFSGSTLSASGITVPASGSTTIVFTGAIAAGASPGDTIDNCADISNPSGVGASPCASTVTVSPSAIAASGSKPLYLYSDSTLSRNIATSQSSVTIGQGVSQTWTLSPALQSPVTISPDVTTLSIIPLQLYLSSDAASQSRTVEVELACSSGGTTYSESKIFDGTAVNNAYLSGDTANPTLVIFNNLTISTDHTCPAGATWDLTVSNDSSSGGVRVHPTSAGENSFISLPSLNVVNVDSVTGYDAAYSATTTPANGYFGGGQTIYLRAVVSDPFGSFDITSAAITIKNPYGTAVITDAAMIEVADSGTLTKTYEYAYILPTTDAGPWTATVTAEEGYEGTISDDGVGAFNLGLPDITLVKMVQTFSDPVHGTTSPYSIPGAVMRYTILSTNTGYGSADVDSVTLSDQIPAQTDLVVSGSPVTFIDGAGAQASGLTFSAATDVTYFDTSDTPVAPTADANGVDPAVRKIVITPQGTFLASDGTDNPKFSIIFYVRVR